MIEELKQEIDDLKKLVSINFHNPILNNTYLSSLRALQHSPVSDQYDPSGYRQAPVSRELIMNLISWFFKANAAIIDSIFQDAQVRNDFSYFIVLRPDTEDNRNIFFDFLDIYEDIKAYSKPSIYFQFVSERLKKEIMNKKVQLTF